MPNHADGRGVSLLAASDPETWIVESYLIAGRGDLEEALRIAAHDVLKLNHLAAETGERTRWGFMLRHNARAQAPAAE